MHKIKFITDSASDIPKELEEKYGIEIMCFPITVEDKSFHDRDYPIKEYYDLIMNASSMPVHAQLTVYQFDEMFYKYACEGYTDIINISIASKGSATYNNSVMAKNDFFVNHPEFKDKLNIYTLDSGNYTGTYGYPVVTAAEKAEKGASPEEIVAYLQDWFDNCTVMFGTYSLDFAKKSGRISVAAAFVGELLGMRPVFEIRDGVSHVNAKVRGDKLVVPKLVDLVAENIIPDTPYVVMEGYDPKPTDEAAKELTKRLGYPPVMRCDIGGVIAANAGPRTVAVAFKTKAPKK